MAVRRILQMEIPEDMTLLKSKANRITSFDAGLQKLVDDLIDTMHKAGGVGLAANQVGVLRRVLVAEQPAEVEELEDGTTREIAPPQLYVMINPEIIKHGPEQVTMNEGCLSLPGRYGDVPRHSWVTVKYQDRQGKEQRIRRAETQMLKVGHIVQHEIDHLDGVLFTERMADITTMVDYRADDEARQRMRRRRMFARRQQEQAVGVESGEYIDS